MKYTTEQIREAVIAELKDRLLIPDVEKLHIVILDAAFKRLPDRLQDDTKTKLEELLPFIIDKYQRDDRFQGYWDRKKGRKITETDIIKKAKREWRKERNH